MTVKSMHNEARGVHHSPLQFVLPMMRFGTRTLAVRHQRVIVHGRVIKAIQNDRDHSHVVVVVVLWTAVGHNH